MNNPSPVGGYPVILSVLQSFNTFSKHLSTSVHILRCELQVRHRGTAGPTRDERRRGKLPSVVLKTVFVVTLVVDAVVVQAAVVVLLPRTKAETFCRYCRICQATFFNIQVCPRSVNYLKQIIVHPLG